MCGFIEETRMIRKPERTGKGLRMENVTALKWMKTIPAAVWWSGLLKQPMKNKKGKQSGEAQEAPVSISLRPLE